MSRTVYLCSSEPGCFYSYTTSRSLNSSSWTFVNLSKNRHIISLKDPSDVIKRPRRFSIKKSPTSYSLQNLMK